MLLACGFIMLTRLSLDKGLDKAFKQFVIVAAAAILSWLVPFIMERFWQLYKFQWVYAGIGLAALLVVWVAGNESFGAQLSLTVGGISIQPSEFVKISFVFFVASMFYQSLDFKNICITTVVAALHVVILVLSKDLGSALIFFISYVIMLFIATGNWLYLIAAGVLGKGATSIAYTLFDHVRRRFTADALEKITAERVLAELAEIAFADLGAEPAPPVKVGDKLRALELIYKYLGLGDGAAAEEPVVIVDEAPTEQEVTP